MIADSDKVPLPRGPRRPPGGRSPLAVYPATTKAGGSRLVSRIRTGFVYHSGFPFGRVAHCGPAGRAGRYTDGTAPGPTSTPIPPALRARSQPEPETGNPPTQTINAGLHDHHGADIAPKVTNFPASVSRPPRLRAPRRTWLHSTRHPATRAPPEARTQLALRGVDEARSEAADPTRASDAWLPAPEPVASMAEQPAGRRRSHRSSCASSPRWAVRTHKLANWKSGTSRSSGGSISSQDLHTEHFNGLQRAVVGQAPLDTSSVASCDGLRCNRVRPNLTLATSTLWAPNASARGGSTHSSRTCARIDRSRWTASAVGFPHPSHAGRIRIKSP